MTKKDKNVAKHSLAISDKIVGRHSQDKQYQQVRPDKTCGSRSVNTYEDGMAATLDIASDAKRLNKMVKKMNQGKIDVHGFLQAVSADALLELACLAFTKKANDKTRLTAVLELLDRAGYTKIQKHAIVGSLDPKASSDELISAIMGMKASGQGMNIEIEDDEDDKD